MGRSPKSTGRTEASALEDMSAPQHIARAKLVSVKRPSLVPGLQFERDCCVCGTPFRTEQGAHITLGIACSVRQC
jgi:hypothetical protein